MRSWLLLGARADGVLAAAAAKVRASAAVEVVARLAHQVHGRDRVHPGTPAAPPDPLATVVVARRGRRRTALVRVLAAGLLADTPGNL